LFHVILSLFARHLTTSHINLLTSRAITRPHTPSRETTNNEIKCLLLAAKISSIFATALSGVN
jgi:hypothetical protein